MTPQPPLSIHDVPPLEDGGVLARTGFTFQDHTAVACCLDMIQHVDLKQVWCETHDDLTLIWADETRERVEFVQAKSSQLDQLWSAAKLCQRSGGPGSSIIERSLQNDRILEPCAFRLVTACPVSKELEVLTLPFSSPERGDVQAWLPSLADGVRRRIEDFRSPNNNDCSFWLSNVLWVVGHGIDQIRNDNRLRLRHIIEKAGAYLISDQIEEVYSKLLRMVIDAAEAKWSVDPQANKIRRENILSWFQAIVQEIQFPVAAGGGKNMAEKMGPNHAGLPADCIEAAHETRRRYRAEVLQPQYLGLSDRKLVESEVAATLTELRSQLDCGAIPDSGLTFHDHCLKALRELWNHFAADTRPPLDFLHGCMYNIADRCTHRFRRATV